MFVLTNTLKSGGAEKQSIYLVKTLSSYYDVTLIVYYGNEYDDRMLALLDGYEAKVIWLKDGHLASLMFLYKLFRRNKGGIVISYLATTNSINAIIGFIAGIKTRIGGIRSSKHNLFKMIIQMTLHNFLLSGSVFNNLVGFHYLTNNGFNTERSYYIPNAVDIPNRPLIRSRKEIVTILSIGRFIDVKDYQTAIKSFQKIKKQYKTQYSIRYIIIGHGPLEMELRKFIQVCNINDDVELIINPTDVDYYYKQADIYLSTSLFEGLSNSIMEAMSYSLPVVATDVGDNNELVIHGKTGFLERVKDVDAITDKIAILIEDRELRVSMGENAYEHISKKFSIEIFSQKYVTLIEQITNETKT
ncbi:MAG: glycosyltransferase [Candidatus Izemoplasmataceae bacterium]